MAYQRNSTRVSLQDREEIAGVVADRLETLPKNLPWTMTITRGRSGDYSVRSVIDTLWDDTEQEQVAQFFSQTQPNT